MRTTLAIFILLFGTSIVSADLYFVQILKMQDGKLVAKKFEKGKKPMDISIVLAEGCNIGLGRPAVNDKAELEPIREKKIPDGAKIFENMKQPYFGQVRTEKDRAVEILLLNYTGDTVAIPIWDPRPPESSNCIIRKVDGKKLTIKYVRFNQEETFTVAENVKVFKISDGQLLPLEGGLGSEVITKGGARAELVLDEARNVRAIRLLNPIK